MAEKKFIIKLDASQIGTLHVGLSAGALKWPGTSTASDIEALGQFINNNTELGY
jgi:hypothetical protein